MLQVRRQSLDVPGANLYYEVRGSGPVLLMVPGGPADAAVFARIAEALADRHTVVTYDPRGLSHSRLTGPLDDSQMVEVMADDLHRLLSTVTREKACIFASSGGCAMALELVVRHPEQVATVVVHEPPCASLTRDPQRTLRGMEDVHDTYRAAGLWPAMGRFMEVVGIKGGPPPAEGEPTPEAQEAMAQMERNFDFFIGRYLVAVARYEPDIEALKACSCRIVPAVGEESAGQLAHDGGLGLARLLGTEASVFPGAHGGFDTHATAFAVRLDGVIARRG